MAAMAWSLNGLDAKRWRVQRGSLYRPPIGTRRTTLSTPGQHGVVSAGLPVFDEPQVALELLCQASTGRTLEDVTNELYGVLAAPSIVLGRVSDGVETSAVANLVSATPGQYMGQAVFFTVVLAVPGVFFSGDRVANSPVVVAPTDVVEVPTLAGSTVADPTAVVRVQGPLTNVLLENPVSGTTLQWGGTLTGTEYLFLHLDTLQARKSTSAGAWASGGTDVTAGVNYYGAATLQLWPHMEAGDPADRRVAVQVDGAGFGASTAVAVQAAPTYL